MAEAPNTLIYRGLHSFLNLCTRIFFGSVSVRGEKNIPDGKEPVILAGTHQNGLIDPVIIYSICSKRQITPVAAVYLFKMPVIGTILRMLGGVAVTRPQDNHGQAVSSSSALESMAKVLSNQGVLCIFPEGVSHNSPSVLDLKSGFARASYMALKANPNLQNVHVVPVGLNYNAKNRFRSDVYVEFGQPLVLNREWAERYDTNQKDALHEVTSSLKVKLQKVIFHAKSPEVLKLAQLARQIVTDDKRQSHEDYVKSTKTFVNLLEMDSNKEVYESLEEMNRLLEMMHLRVSDFLVKDKLSLSKVFYQAGRMLLSLPGSLFHAPIGIISSLVGKKIAGGYDDQEAHYKVMVTMMLVPVFYTGSMIANTMLFNFKTACVLNLFLVMDGLLAVNVRPLNYSFTMVRRVFELLLLDKQTTRRNIAMLKEELLEKI
ncbi:hypothetical protein AKO1_014473 [Acrasis kona]|uniref:Phospholipid/glycerol acyltransferase domain-containing protein n=1 Tax=Acrasis kona TaxID=1008807 RepID=A0AAW2YYB8_9EUKA